MVRPLASVQILAYQWALVRIALINSRMLYYSCGIGTYAINSQTVIIQLTTSHSHHIPSHEMYRKFIVIFKIESTAARHNRDPGHTRHHLQASQAGLNLNPQYFCWATIAGSASTQNVIFAEVISIGILLLGTSSGQRKMVLVLILVILCIIICRVLSSPVQDDDPDMVMDEYVDSDRVHVRFDFNSCVLRTPSSALEYLHCIHRCFIVLGTYAYKLNILKILFWHAINHMSFSS